MLLLWPNTMEVLVEVLDREFSTRRAPLQGPRTRFDPMPTPRYYTASPMSGSGLQTYAPLVLHLLIAAVLAGLISSLSVLIGWRRPNRAKQQAYECGMEPTGDARE